MARISGNLPVPIKYSFMENVILIVDDHQETVDLLSTLLLQNGWVPQRANNGEDALKSASRHLPSFVISDLSMPGMSGFALAETLRSTYGERCPTMIAVTAWTDGAIAKQALEVGFRAVLTKPFDFQQLLAAINLSRLAKNNQVATPTCP